MLLLSQTFAISIEAGRGRRSQGWPHCTPVSKKCRMAITVRFPYNEVKAPVAHPLARARNSSRSVNSSPLEPLASLAEAPDAFWSNELLETLVCEGLEVVGAVAEAGAEAEAEEEPMVSKTPWT